MGADPRGGYLAARHPEAPLLRRLLVLTSSYHTRRALTTFAHVFAGTAVEIGVRSSTRHSAAPPARWRTAAYDRSYVRDEWSAVAFYLLRYGIIPTP